MMHHQKFSRQQTCILKHLYDVQNVVAHCHNMDLALRNYTQELEDARLELEVLRARKDTALLETEAAYAMTALALAQERNSTLELESATSATQREKTALASIAALSLEMFAFTRQKGNFHFYLSLKPSHEGAVYFQVNRINQGNNIFAIAGL